MRRAFTLVELLITVAIIAILAAVATPNFLEAQARSKIARVQSDMRALATALEAYAIDLRSYPVYALMQNTAPYQVEDPAQTHGQDHFEHFSRVPGLCITSPVAYIGTIPRDSFASVFAGISQIAHDYSYKNSRYNVKVWGNKPVEPWMGPGGAQLIADWGEWRLSSAGPDRTRTGDIKLNIIYDATNGTISRGDIVRSQRRSSSQPK